MRLSGSRCITTILLLAIVLLASGLRVNGIGFGLPALHDPDEPMFVLGSLKLLRNHSFNPGWFGHPGTTTIYCLALIEILVFVIGHGAGYFTNVHAFELALYHDPTILFLPARYVMAAGGVLCVFLTFVLGRRLFGDREGLLAAGLLAIDPLHIAYSQLIRTDIQATAFVLASMIFTVDIVRRGRMRDYLLPAIFIGLAVATKWPAATFLSCPIAAGLVRIVRHPGEFARQARNIALLMLASVAALLAVSPFLLLDYPTLLHDLHGEARPHHLGATGFGFFGNLDWYVSHALRGAMGVSGLVAIALGVVFTVRRSGEAAAILLSGSGVFLLAISAQHLIWARWMLILLPMLSIFAAVGLGGVVDAIIARAGPRIGRGAFVVLALLMIVPMALTVRSEAIERLNDTRDLASAWARQHIPARSSVIVEHFAFDLLPQPWTLLFPLGSIGCTSAEGLLGRRIGYTSISKLRRGQPVVDIGTIDPAMMGSCNADYAILTDYDRYLAEPQLYGAEIDIYRRLLRGGREMAIFRPEAGRIGGPIVRIVRLNRS